MTFFQCNLRKRINSDNNNRTEHRTIQKRKNKNNIPKNDQYKINTFSNNFSDYMSEKKLIENYIQSQIHENRNIFIVKLSNRTLLL